MILQDFQEKIGVTADGIFGPKTLKAATKFYKMSNERAAHFFGQCAHESGNFTVFTENLNYSVQGLNRVFKKYFPGNLAVSYAKQPIRIASRVYADRMGNGNEASQEGWKFRGRGAIQTTGKYNYQLLADFLDKPEIMTNPDLVATDYIFESALFYFDRRNIWKIADRGVDSKTIMNVTKLINGGYNGLQDRITKTNQFYRWLKA
jgi:putative chitinase